VDVTEVVVAASLPNCVAVTLPEDRNWIVLLVALVPAPSWTRPVPLAEALDPPANPSVAVAPVPTAPPVVADADSPTAPPKVAVAADPIWPPVSPVAYDKCAISRCQSC
jgi:hypothetical protein